MWTARTEQLAGGADLQFWIDRDSEPATVEDVIRAWQSDEAFRTLFNSWLAETPFAAFRWETPGVSSATLKQPFEFVVLDSPNLDRRPDPDAFAEHFVGSESTVASFANLSGDAAMVVPRPLAEPTAYGHLAAFVRQAPEPQRQALWQLVGEAMERRVGDKPVWLSTAGAGVAWLHVRLDDRPKYYGYVPYRRLG